MKKSILTFALLFFPFIFLHAETGALIKDENTFEKAKVVSIIKEEKTILPVLNIPSIQQTLQAKVISGENSGLEFTVENNYSPFEVDDIFYARHFISGLGDLDSWSVSDPYRLPTLGALLALFILLIFFFGGKQGVRGLASLIGSMFLIFYLLLPSIDSGRNAILMSVSVASLIIIVGSYITHGINRTTSAAVLGMIVTVIITGVLGYITVITSNLTGFSAEESVYLNLNSGGSLDLIGLLYGGIIIGLLGVLYDSAIGQAVAIEELVRAGKHMTKLQIYSRGIRIGREHIGALVNTLAIAYVGASLPLLLLLQKATAGLPFMINSEIIATEIIRILIGSIGVVLAVPITTFIATSMLYGKVTGESTHQHVHA